MTIAVSTRETETSTPATTLKKLSEALREAMRETGVRQCRNMFIEPHRESARKTQGVSSACALTMIAYGLWGEWWCGDMDIVVHFAELQDQLAAHAIALVGLEKMERFLQRNQLPDTIHDGIAACLTDTIIYHNDTDRWSFERIADWLEAWGL